MDFDSDVVSQILNKLREAREVLERHHSIAWPEFASNRDKQYIIEHALLIAIQSILDICAHLIAAAGETVPADYADMPRQIAKLGIIPAELGKRLARAAGFRNRLVHNYRHVDLEIVFQAFQQDLQDLDQFQTHISRLIARLSKDEETNP